MRQSNLAGGSSPWQIAFDFTGITATPTAQVICYSANTWTQIVGVLDIENSGIHIYSNGAAAIDCTITGSVTAMTAPISFEMGGYIELTRYTTGRIDDAAIWHRAFTAAEVRELYLSSR